MSTERDDRLLDLVRRTFASREHLVDTVAADRIQNRLRTDQRTSGTVWLVSAAAVAAVIAGVFVWIGPHGFTDSDKPTTPLGPAGCGAPEAFIGPGSTGQTWEASTGNPVAVDGGLHFGTPADSPDQKDFRFGAVTLVVGEVGAVGSPTKLDAGIGVLASREATVRDGQAPTKGRVVFETDQPGRYPVWVLVEGACGGDGTSLGASPVGFVEVERSVTTPCRQVNFEGRRYLLGTGPELGPGEALGTGQGSDCEGGTDQEVQVYTVSELSRASAINVVYPGLGVRAYHVEPTPNLDVITYRATSSTPGKTQFSGTLSSYGGCVVLIDGGAIRLVAFERDHVTVQGRVLNLLPRFGDQVGYQVFAGDKPFGSAGGLGDRVEFTGTLRPGAAEDLPSTFQVPASCKNLPDVRDEIAVLD